MKRAIFVLGILLFPLIGFADTIHVPGDQPTIQAGIDAAVNGDTVLVADGTYTGDGNRDIDFLGKAITVRSENGAENCVIDCEGAFRHRGFYFHSGEGQESVVDGFTIRDGRDHYGAGIRCVGSSPMITNNTIASNHAGLSGGGIYCSGASPTIDNNVIAGNVARGGSMGFFWGSGGGIYCVAGSHPTITNNRISGNSAVDFGGGIVFNGGSATVTNNTINGNHAGSGGGIYCSTYSSVAISNCTITSNTAIIPFGGWGGGVYYERGPYVVAVTNTILWANESRQGAQISGNPTVSCSDVQGGWSGEGNIDEDPLFVIGALGDFYLSQIVAGQAENSPCVDAGDPSSELIQGSTRTDGEQDWGVVDMGYHYPRIVQPFITAGPGPAEANPPQVRAFPSEQDAEYLFDFPAYGLIHYGVNVTCGDVNVNEMDEIITGAGPGEIYGPHVRGFQLDGTPLPGLSFLAYGTNKYGVNVAAGDIDGDGFDEIITGAGPGTVFGPHVRGWDFDGSGTVTHIPGVSFFAYGTPKWGVNVATGDIDGDGFDEIVTGAGPGEVYGPHVRGWNVDGGPATAMPGVSFLAYGTNEFGVNVTCGDLDGDGIDEIVTGAGPGPMFGAHVCGWKYDGAEITLLPDCNFLAWGDMRYGARVCAGADLNGDGQSELVVGGGPDPDAGTEVKVFTYDVSGVDLWISLEAFPGLTNGTNVAGGRF